MIQQALDRPISRHELAEAQETANRKLNDIITREGDADGVRREPWYFDMLVEEALRSSRAAVFTRTTTKAYREIEQESVINGDKIKDTERQLSVFGTKPEMACQN